MNFPTLRNEFFLSSAICFQGISDKKDDQKKIKILPFFPETSPLSTFIVRFKIIKLKVRENYTIHEKSCRLKRQVGESHFGRVD